MADLTTLVAPTILLSEDEVRKRVDDLADKLAPRVDDETVAVCLLTGGLWFAADLTRALWRRGRNLLFDALWLASYGDEKTSSGRIRVHAPLQRSVKDRRVLLLDDVLDSGLCLSEAVKMIEAEGAREVITCVFARKPWPTERPIDPDYIGWEAPSRYLVGYGLDSAGSMRGLPGIGALD